MITFSDSKEQLQPTKQPIKATLPATNQALCNLVSFHMFASPTGVVTIERRELPSEHDVKQVSFVPRMWLFKLLEFRTGAKKKH